MPRSRTDVKVRDRTEGEDTLSGWSTDADADVLAELVAGESGASVRRRTAPDAGPLAVLEEVRVIDRFRSGSGGLRVLLRRGRRPGWPLRGDAPGCARRREPAVWEALRGAGRSKAAP
ncbi:hypothetical protein KPP03845_200010 (plasmid) [Streptomyces xanthophaeus]|nr:hypothetical protein KPP03845_200010 [Streptomyces xanthophaeus]